MSALEAKRTLVKSPPEVWAKVSDPEVLADHLADLGPIQITRVEPETVVHWEGDRATGAVHLEAGGWGTKVTLTAELAEAPAAVEAPVAAEGATSESVAMREIQREPPAQEAVPEPAAAPAVPEPAAEPAVPEPAEMAPPKRGIWSRWFGRKARAVPAAEAEPAAEATAPEPPATLAEPAGTPEAAAPAEPAATQPSVHAEPEAATPEPAEAPDARADTPPTAHLDVADALAILEAALDRLGAAHHRPFSRA